MSSYLRLLLDVTSACQQWCKPFGFAGCRGRPYQPRSHTKSLAHHMSSSSICTSFACQQKGTLIHFPAQKAVKGNIFMRLQKAADEAPQCTHYGLARLEVMALAKARLALLLIAREMLILKLFRRMLKLRQGKLRARNLQCVCRRYLFPSRST